MTEPDTTQPGSEGIPIDQAVAETSGELAPGEELDTRDADQPDEAPPAESIPLAEGEQKTPEQTDNGPDADAPELPQDPDWQPDPLSVLPDYSHGPEVTR